MKKIYGGNIVNQPFILKKVVKVETCRINVLNCFNVLYLIGSGQSDLT